MRLMAFKGFDNVEVFTAAKTDQTEDFDFSAAGFTSGKVWVHDQSVVATVAGTQISAVLGDLDVEVGEHEAKLAVYSEAYPDGLVIAGPGMPEPMTIVVKE